MVEMSRILCKTIFNNKI